MQSRTTERLCRSAVRLIVARLENVGHTEARAGLLEAAADPEAQLLTLDNARARYENESTWLV